MSFCFFLKPLPDDKILDLSKLKQIADDIFKCVLNGKKVPYRVENIVRKVFHSYLSFVRQNVVLYGNGLIARKPNWVPTTKNDIDDNVEEDNFLLVTFRWSNTIQFGEREFVCPLIALNNAKICPIQAFQKLKALK